MITSILAALQDLVIMILPDTSKKERFAFLIHQRDMPNVHVK